MNTEEMKGRILEVLGAPGARVMSSGSIALRLGINWNSNPTAYERVGKTLAKLKKAGSVVLERGKGWRLRDASVPIPKVHHARKKTPAEIKADVDQFLRETKPSKKPRAHAAKMPERSNPHGLSPHLFRRAKWNLYDKAGRLVGDVFADSAEEAPAKKRGHRSHAEKKRPSTPDGALDGTRITLTNAESLVRAHIPDAIVEPYQAFQTSKKAYWIHRAGSAAPIGEGPTKKAAWKDAAQRLGLPSTAPATPRSHATARKKQPLEKAVDIVHTLAMPDGRVITTTWHDTRKQAEARIKSTRGRDPSSDRVFPDNVLGRFRAVTWSLQQGLSAQALAQKRGHRSHAEKKQIDEALSGSNPHGLSPHLFRKAKWNLYDKAGRLVGDVFADSADEALRLAGGPGVATARLPRQGGR